MGFATYNGTEPTFFVVSNRSWSTILYIANMFLCHIIHMEYQNVHRFSYCVFDIDFVFSFVFEKLMMMD